MAGESVELLLCWRKVSPRTAREGMTDQRVMHALQMRTSSLDSNGLLHATSNILHMRMLPQHVFPAFSQSYGGLRFNCRGFFHEECDTQPRPWNICPHSVMPWASGGKSLHSEWKRGGLALLHVCPCSALSLRRYRANCVTAAWSPATYS